MYILYQLLFHITFLLPSTECYLCLQDVDLSSLYLWMSRICRCIQTGYNMYIRVSDKPINLTSPRFPTDMYPPNVNTHYNITVSPNYALKLTIVSLNLEPRCCNYLQVIEFNRPIYTFRGILPSF